MSETKEKAPPPPTTRELLATKTGIRQDLLVAVNHLTESFQAKKQAGLYRSRQESKQSVEWVELMKHRQELEKVTEEVLELRDKLEREG